MHTCFPANPLTYEPRRPCCGACYGQAGSGPRRWTLPVVCMRPRGLTHMCTMGCTPHKGRSKEGHRQDTLPAWGRSQQLGGTPRPGRTNDTLCGHAVSPGGQDTPLHPDRWPGLHPVPSSVLLRAPHRKACRTNRSRQPSRDGKHPPRR